MSSRRVFAFAISNTLAMIAASLFAYYQLFQWPFSFWYGNLDEMEHARIHKIMHGVEQLFYWSMVPILLTSALWFVLVCSILISGRANNLESQGRPSARI